MVYSRFDIYEIQVQGRPGLLRYVAFLKPKFAKDSFIGLLREVDFDRTRQCPSESTPCLAEFESAETILWAQKNEQGIFPARPEIIEVLEDWFQELVICRLEADLHES